MRILALALSLLVSNTAFAVISLEDAETLAKNTLATTEVRLDQESARSYFFLDPEFYGEEDFPCLHGVLIDKKSGQVVSPDVQNDDDINTNFAYSDTTIEADTHIIINCAD